MNDYLTTKELQALYRHKCRQTASKRANEIGYLRIGNRKLVHRDALTAFNEESRVQPAHDHNPGNRSKAISFRQHKRQANIPRQSLRQESGCDFFSW